MYVSSTGLKAIYTALSTVLKQMCITYLPCPLSWVNQNTQVLKDFPWGHTESDEILKDSTKDLTTRPHLSCLPGPKRNTVFLCSFLLLYQLPVMSVYENLQQKQRRNRTT